MKKLVRSILILIAVFISCSTHAQYKWSAGIRTGLEVTNLFSVDPHLDYKDNMLWTNEVFISRRIGKHFEADVAMRYKANQDSDSMRFSSLEGNSSSITNQKQMSLQVNLRYYFIQVSKYEVFGQIGSSADYNRTRNRGWYNEIYYGPRDFSRVRSSLDFFKRLYFGAGLNYNIAPRLYASATILAGYKTTTARNMSVDGQSSFSGNVLAGIAWRF
ncbi:MAG: hypothetical protein EOO94_03415 [Pedobacter sp.]|nr:MAG: hypothetical protein EOO94_03415 [Pedobacter sp.]